jgi:hypothetical protein
MELGDPATFLSDFLIPANGRIYLGIPQRPPGEQLAALLVVEAELMLPVRLEKSDIFFLI